VTLTVQGSTAFHPTLAENRRNLHQRLGVVVGNKKREPSSEQTEENDARTPDVDRYVFSSKQKDRKTPNGSERNNEPKVWSGHLKSTSGARNPLVPALFALTLPLFSFSGLGYPTLFPGGRGFAISQSLYHCSSRLILSFNSGQSSSSGV
jgi:hypothetical protein